MSDPVQNFEYILKKQCSKRGVSLYSDNKQHNKHTLKPQDVISSVYNQLKAIQVADSLKSEKNPSKDLQKYEKANFLSVNKLPVYEEVPKQTTKFDTQCVSDTQLINIIEDAEIIDVHRGMTQEFETPFCHYTEKQNKDDEKTDTDVHIEDNDKVSIGVQSIYDTKTVKNVPLQNNDKVSKDKETVFDKDTMDKIHENVTVAISDSLLVNSMDNNIGTDNSLIMLSPIMCSNNVEDRETGLNSQDSKKEENTQVEDFTQMLNECIEIEDEADMVIERPVSPIFMHKHVKTKSKTPSPLIFNLDKFEHFEQIAIPILETNDLKTAKQVINSQILDKELHINIDEEIFLNGSLVLQNKNAKCDPLVEINTEFKTHIVGKPDSDTDLEFIELDKATSDDLINKVMNGNSEGNLKVRAESEILKDEILFSSDEEDNYVHKSYQDLPFTCALETSFYDQSDVLDKTMYVGFQTASNKTIQVFTESFALAQNILSDDTKDELTVTDLVKTCESHAKNKTQDVNENQVKMDPASEVKEFNLAQKDDKEYELECDMKNTVEEPKDLHYKQNERTNFEGFMTASNKEIKLSQKALARCKKVFQDIDLKENFDTQTEEENLQSKVESHEGKIPLVADIAKTEFNKSFTDDDLQNMDDVIIQEFENIEMSLEEDKVTDKIVASIEFKTASNKDIQISETALTKIKDVFKDIDFDEDLNEVDIRKIDKEENALPKIMEDPQLSSIISDTNLAGFRTASNKNIDISKEALAKTKNIFQDIDSTEFPNKSSNSLDKANQNLIDFEQPSTSKAIYVGFKTANNRNIKISEQALAKTKNIFKDIDSTDFELPTKKDKDFRDNTNEDKFYNLSTINTSTFVGFKTANNKDINISKEALVNTRKIFEAIDSANFKLPNAKSNDFQDNKSKGTANFYQPSTSNISFVGFKTTDDMNIKTIESVKDTKKTDVQEITYESDNLNHGFVGFKTANNRKINISEESLAKTKNIFKDIDPTDFELSERANKDSEMKNKGDNKSTSLTEIDWNQPSTSKASFLGFKTANNKKISISEESLAKTKNIFKDLDSNDFVVVNTSNRQLQETGGDRKNAYPDLKEPNEPLTSTNNFVGFKTGNNKAINVSEIAFAKTKNIFKDLDSIELQIPEKNKDHYPNIEKDIDKTESGLISKDRIAKNSRMTTNNDFKIPENTGYQFQGFQTASNKQVKVSADALVKSRKIFQDIDVSENCSIEGKQLEGNIVKCTENKILKTEKESLLINKGTGSNIEDPNIDDLLLDAKSSPVLKGFQTANKKPVTVSKEALAKSRKLFQDIDTIPDEDDPEPELYGFKTSNDEVVAVSQKALAETRKLFDDANKGNNSFKGFQTASDKKVAISEDSLAKSRKIFQDIENHEKNEDSFKNNEKKYSSINFGFKTGTNRDIVVSEEAIARSKRRFSEIDNSNEQTKNKKDKISEENIGNIIDTQVLNNFEESLHTEDFHESPTKSKRSGSPILLCPRAKRRKRFETPYSQKLPKKQKKKEIINDKDTNKITFNENYKKNKTYTLKDLAKLTKDNTTIIDPYLLQFNFDNLLQFKFHDSRNGLSYDNMTIDLLKELFLNSVNSKLIPNGWLDNHLKLILWKLISYEIKFKLTVVCSARNVMDQLKYRYDKELYNAQRPALRRILEKDDVASKTIVLCVAAIYVDGVNVASTTTTNNMELLLTDGWYCIRATIDKMLAQLVCQGKICIGTKIVTNGAELVNCEQGISPWEDTSAVRLKLFGNSTRRARWDARLGYHGNGAILSQLSSVKLDGGKVSKLRMFVTRVYPALYVEKFEDGSTVTRSERLEHLHQMKSEAERQVVMEKIYEEVEREFSDQESQDSEGLSDLSNKRTCLDSGSQIAKVMKRSKDPAEFRAGLTSSQSRLLEHHSSKRREILLQDIQQRIRDKIEKAGVCVNRNVVTLLKIRVAGVTERSGVEVTKGMMSIWKPTDAVLEIIKEGAWIDVMNVVPTAVRYSEIQISAGRQSVFSISKYKEPEKFIPYTKLLKRKCFTIKDLAQNPSIATDYNEIDTVGFIFLIDPSVKEFDSTRQPFQNVFLADADKNMICINFWDGLKKFGFQNVLDTGQIVACANLQKRAGNTRKSIPQYRVTDFSYFTKSPKNENTRNLIDNLSKKFLSLDRRKFCDDCVVLKNNYSVIKHNNENISPYRFNNSEYNMSKNKIFIDSPLIRPNKIDDNFNLTGLDFESTFKQTDTQNLSEEVLLRKKKVNEKIARLKMYGEPPPLSTIHIINRSKHASSSYKSPLSSNNPKNIPHRSKSENAVNSKSDSSVNVASVKETPEKCANFNESDVACSPVLMNRTYVKSFNPVKINFDVKDNNDSKVDHFAEDFDGSPPLSLD